MIQNNKFRNIIFSFISFLFSSLNETLFITLPVHVKIRAQTKHRFSTYQRSRHFMASITISLNQLIFQAKYFKLWLIKRRPRRQQFRFFRCSTILKAVEDLGILCGFAECHPRYVLLQICNGKRMKRISSHWCCSPTQISSNNVDEEEYQVCHCT